MADTIQLHRCDGCRQKGSDCPICPQSKPCSFIQSFKDGHYKYKVVRKGKAYTICRWNTSRCLWESAPNFNKHYDFDTAQLDLNQKAHAEGWEMNLGPGR